MTDNELENELMELLHKWSSQAIDAPDDAAEAYRNARDDLHRVIKTSDGEGHRLAGAEPKTVPEDAPRDDNDDPTEL